MDPIADKFPELSVYNYASNDPVKNIDLHGLQGHRADMHLHNEMREQKGNQEYEDAKKSIQQVEKKALISIGAIAILLIPTPEDILLGLAINGLSKAGEIVKAGRAVEKVVSKTDEVVDAAKGGMTAYETALAGGKHSGFLKNYVGRSADEINKAIRSMQSGNQGIGVHLDKIANPTKYVPNWSTLRPSHQQSLINGWQNTVTKHTEQIQILNTLLGK